MEHFIDGEKDFANPNGGRLPSETELNEIKKDEKFWDGIEKLKLFSSKESLGRAQLRLGEDIVKLEEARKDTGYKNRDLLVNILENIVKTDERIIKNTQESMARISELLENERLNEDASGIIDKDKTWQARDN